MESAHNVIEFEIPFGAFLMSIMKLASIFLNLPLAKKLLLVSAVPMLAVLVLSLLTYRSVETFSLDEDHLNDVYHIQSASAEFMRLVVDLETGFRGYVLTQQPQFLQPLSSGQATGVGIGQFPSTNGGQ